MARTMLDGDGGFVLMNADSRRMPLADGSVHCCVTSPPYFGLRSYLPRGSKLKPLEIGLEASIEAYVATMVAVFREVRRVLRDDGTAWVNLGDSFNAHPGQRKEMDKAGPKQVSNTASVGSPSRSVSGVKPKDLILIPFRVALALQADGWWVRQTVIWSKPNPMPESVADRPSTAHEYVFLLSKRDRYFYDGEAIKEPAQNRGEPEDEKLVRSVRDSPRIGGDGRFSRSGGSGTGFGSFDSRNRRSVWTVTTQPTPDAHFATWPRKLVEPMIRAGTSEMGCCPACKAPWVRVVEKERTPTRPGVDTKITKAAVADDGVPDAWSRSNVIGNRDPRRHVTTTMTRRWVPTCPCGAALIPVPCVVLDPFVGSGKSIEVARLLGRYAVGLDLNMDYLRDIARHRAVRGERPHRVPDRIGPRRLPLRGQMSFLDGA